MSDAEKIFVILDPTTMEQPSLVMAESIATDINEHRDDEAALHVYCCVDEGSIQPDAALESDELRMDIQARTEHWIERIVDHTRALGLDVETEVEISDDWRKAITAAVARQNCLVAIKGMSQHPKFLRLFRDTSDWRLLRDASCPVYLVKRSPKRPVRKVLAAIKHRTEDQAYTEANDMILDTARRISTILGAELHVVTAYRDIFSYPDRQKFADRCGLPRSQVRAEQGSAQDAIARAAGEIVADLVVIARVGKPAATRDVGHTAEKLIDAMDTNLLVLPMRAADQR